MMTAAARETSCVLEPRVAIAETQIVALQKNEDRVLDAIGRLDAKLDAFRNLALGAVGSLALALLLAALAVHSASPATAAAAGSGSKNRVADYVGFAGPDTVRK